MDYLPFVLDNWLCESSRPGSLRENYVLLDGINLIGFVSVYFLNNRNTAVKYAVRVDKELRGKGYGKILEHLLQDTLTKKYPQLGSFISAIADHGEIRQLGSSKFGKVLTVKAILVYKFRCNQLSSLVEEGNPRLAALSREEFAGVLRAQRLRHLLENDLLHMQFVVVRPHTEEDIEFAVRKRQTVMAEEISRGGITSLRNEVSINQSSIFSFTVFLFIIFLMSSIFISLTQ